MKPKITKVIVPILIVLILAQTTGLGTVLAFSQKENKHLSFENTLLAQGGSGGNSNSSLPAAFYQLPSGLQEEFSQLDSAIQEKFYQLYQQDLEVNSEAVANFFDPDKNPKLSPELIGAFFDLLPSFWGAALPDLENATLSPEKAEKLIELLPSLVTLSLKLWEQLLMTELPALETLIESLPSILALGIISPTDFLNFLFSLGDEEMQALLARQSLLPAILAYLQSEKIEIQFPYLIQFTELLGLILQLAPGVALLLFDLLDQVLDSPFSLGSIAGFSGNLQDLVSSLNFEAIISEFTDYPFQTQIGTIGGLTGLLSLDRLNNLKATFPDLAPLLDQLSPGQLQQFSGVIAQTLGEKPESFGEFSQILDSLLLSVDYSELNTILMGLEDTFLRAFYEEIYLAQQELPNSFLTLFNQSQQLLGIFGNLSIKGNLEGLLPDLMNLRVDLEGFFPQWLGLINQSLEANPQSSLDFLGNLDNLLIDYPFLREELAKLEQDFLRAFYDKIYNLYYAAPQSSKNLLQAIITQIEGGGEEALSLFLETKKSRQIDTLLGSLEGLSGGLTSTGLLEGLFPDLETLFGDLGSQHWPQLMLVLTQALEEGPTSFENFTQILDNLLLDYPALNSILVGLEQTFLRTFYDKIYSLDLEVPQSSKNFLRVISALVKGGGGDKLFPFLDGIGGFLSINPTSLADFLGGVRSYLQPSLDFDSLLKSLETFQAWTLAIEGGFLEGINLPSLKEIFLSLTSSLEAPENLIEGLGSLASKFEELGYSNLANPLSQFAEMAWFGSSGLQIGIMDVGKYLVNLGSFLRILKDWPETVMELLGETEGMLVGIITYIIDRAINKVLWMIIPEVMAFLRWLPDFIPPVALMVYPAAFKDPDQWTTQAFWTTSIFFDLPPGFLEGEGLAKNSCRHGFFSIDSILDSLTNPNPFNLFAIWQGTWEGGETNFPASCQKLPSLISLFPSGILDWIDGFLPGLRDITCPCAPNKIGVDLTLFSPQYGQSGRFLMWVADKSYLKFFMFQIPLYNIPIPPLGNLLGTKWPGLASFTPFKIDRLLPLSLLFEKPPLQESEEKFWYNNRLASLPVVDTDLSLWGAISSASGLEQCFFDVYDMENQQYTLHPAFAGDIGGRLDELEQRKFELEALENEINKLIWDLCGFKIFCVWRAALAPLLNSIYKELEEINQEIAYLELLEYRGFAAGVRDCSPSFEEPLELNIKAAPPNSKEIIKNLKDFFYEDFFTDLAQLSATLGRNYLISYLSFLLAAFETNPPSAEDLKAKMEDSLANYPYFNSKLEEMGTDFWNNFYQKIWDPYQASPLSDQTPPLIFDPQPTGTISSSTPTLQIKTDEPATCQYDTTNLDSPDGLIHSASLGLLDEGIHSYNIRCQDDNQNLSSIKVEFKIDLTPPSISNLQPSETITLIGDTTVVLIVETNEPAICKYGLLAGQDYEKMPETFSYTGGQHHSSPLTLEEGDYLYLVRCQDQAGNFNLSSTKIKFRLLKVETSYILYSQTLENNCPNYGCTNSLTFSCSGIECNPILDGTLTIFLKGDYDKSDEYTSIYLDGNLIGSAGGFGKDASCSKTEGWGNYDRCKSYGSATFTIAKSTLKNYLSDGNLIVQFQDQSTVNYCCNASHKAKLEFSYAENTPPFIFNPRPAGTIKKNTPTLEITVNESASCGYDSSDLIFASMTKWFYTSTTPGVKYAPLGSLAAGSHSYYIRCQDTAGNQNLSSTKIKFEIDLTSPSILNSQPSGDISDQTPVLFVETNENSTCKYDILDDEYENLLYTFSVTDGKYHSSLLQPLAQGGYSYYVKCQDEVGNQAEEKIEFKIITGPSIAIEHFFQVSRNSAIRDLFEDFNRLFQALITQDLFLDYLDLLLAAFDSRPKTQEEFRQAINNLLLGYPEIQAGLGELGGTWLATFYEKIWKESLDYIHCSSEGREACRIRSYNIDKATNESFKDRAYLNVDYTPPQVEIASAEKAASIRIKVEDFDPPLSNGEESSGLEKCQYNVDGSPFKDRTCNGDFVITDAEIPEGEVFGVLAFSQDKALNLSLPTFRMFYPPEVLGIFPLEWPVGIDYYYQVQAFDYDTPIDYCVFKVEGKEITISSDQSCETPPCPPYYFEFSSLEFPNPADRYYSFETEGEEREVTVTCYDTLGLKGEKSITTLPLPFPTVEFWVDKIFPTETWVNLPTTFYAGVIDVASYKSWFREYENEVTSCDFYIKSISSDSLGSMAIEPLGQGDGYETYLVSIEYTFSAPGEYLNAYVKCKDLRGKTAQGNPVTITVKTLEMEKDKIPPLVSPIWPTEVWVNQPEIFQASVAENDRVDFCDFYIRGQKVSSMELWDFGKIDSLSYYEVTSSYTFYQIGEYENVYAQCQDLAGNIGQGEPVTITVSSPDEIFPQVGPISPPVAPFCTDQIFTATTTDNREVVSCQLFVEGQSQGEMTLSAEPCKEECFATASHHFDQVGEYEVYAQCQDAAGNEAPGPPVMVTVGNAPSPINPSSAAFNLCFYPYPIVDLSWLFTDSDPGDSQSGFRVVIDDNDDFSSLEIDSCAPGLEEEYNTCISGQDFEHRPVGLAYNTKYYWQVQVWDSQGIPSEWVEGPAFTTPLHAWPWPDFGWSPLQPIIDKPIQFENKTICFSSCSYLWNFGDGQTSSMFAPTHNYSTTGTYPLSLKACDDLACCQVVKTLTVYEAGALPPVAESLDILADEPIYVDEEVVFVGVGSDEDGEVVEFQWDFGDGETSTSEGEEIIYIEELGLYTASQVHIYSEPGTYTPQLKVIDDAGRESDVTQLSGEDKTIEVEISFYHSPVAQISCNSSSCGYPVEDDECRCYTGRPLKLVNESTDQDGQDDIVLSEWDIYDWGSDPDSLPCSGLCDFTPPTPAGDYTVELYVEDKMGGSDMATQPFTILQDALADFMCSLDNETWQSCETDTGQPTIRVSEGEVVYFKDDPEFTEHSSASEGATITEWQWYFEDGTPDSLSGLDQTNPAVSFQNIDEGSGRVTLVITDSAGRTAAVTHQIRVTLPLPEWEEIAPY